MDGTQDDLFQMDSSDSSDKSFEGFSTKEVLENVRKDIPVTFDISSNKNLTDNNALDCVNPLD